MTPCETDKHWNWIYTTRDTGAKLTIHGLPVTGEGIQFLHKPTPRQLSELLTAVKPNFGGISSYMR